MEKFSLFKETGPLTTSDNTTMETKIIEQLAKNKNPYHEDHSMHLFWRDAFIAGYITAQSEQLESKAQFDNQMRHKESLKQYWLSCAESKAKWIEAIKEYFDGEHSESIQSFDRFKEQFDLD